MAHDSMLVIFCDRLFADSACISSSARFWSRYELRPATLNVAPFSVTEVENKGSHYSVKVTGFNDANCTRRNSTTTFSQSTQCNGASSSRINLYKSRPKHELGVVKK